VQACARRPGPGPSHHPGPPDGALVDTFAAVPNPVGNGLPALAVTSVESAFGRPLSGVVYVLFGTPRGGTPNARTRIEREFDLDALRQLKQSSTGDITVGGAELAGQAIAAGIVDECRLFLVPIVVGAGKRALPDNVHTQLELLYERRFRSGVVYLRYGVSV